MNDKDVMKLSGVMSEGYGVIPKKVMKDQDLSIEAKALYAFMASYSGAGTTSFPGVDLITDMLGISRQRFNRHRKALEDKGYITVTRKNMGNGKFGNNIYTLEPVPWLQKPTMDNPTMEKPTMENVTTNNNTFNNNTNNNNTNNTLSRNSTRTPYKEIIEYLNEKTGRQYKHTAKANQRVIKARMNEGYTLEDFKTVIDKKYDEWNNDTKMKKFLRPETLFSTNFDRYLNEETESNKNAWAGSDF